MDGPLIVEVLDRRDRVVQRARLERFPAILGRGWSSDVVLDDPHVCAAHLRVALDESGALVAEDLHSVNGIHTGTPSRRVERVPITSGLTVRLGRTQVRFRGAHDPVAPAAVDGGEAPRLLNPALAFGICLLALVVTGVDTYLGSYQPEGVSTSVVYGILLLGLLVLLWSTAWAFVNRVVAQDWRLPAHTATICAFGIGLFLLSLALEYWEFIFPASTAVEVVGSLALALLIAALVNGHMSLLSGAPAARLRVAALVIGLGTVGALELLDRIDADQFSNEMEFASSLKPVPARWLPAESIDQFTARLDEVRQEVDALAKER